MAGSVEDHKTREKQREERANVKANKACIVTAKAKSTVLAYRDFGRAPSPRPIMRAFSSCSNACFTYL